MLSIETARYLFSLQNPFPPVDRRYRLGKIYLAHGAKPSLRRDDEYTWEVYRYLRARVALREPKARVNDVLQKYPDLGCACQIHHGKARVLRPILEAYLLARENRHTIALSLRVNPDTVLSYQKTFYDVEPFLDNPMYVFTRLIGTIGERGLKKWTEPMLWKLLGYVGGAATLGKLFGNLHGVAEAYGEDGVQGWLGQRTKNMLHIKQLLAVNRLKPSDKKDLEYLLRTLGQGRKAKSEGADVPMTAIETHIDAMFKDLTWDIGPRDLPAPLVGWQDTAAELNAEEEMKLIAGVDLPELEEIRNLEFPLGRSNPNPSPRPQGK